MHVSYYGYYLTDTASGTKYRIDLSGLLKKFASASMLKFRRTVKYNGDNVFPLTFIHPTYYFLQSRDNEIVKSVNRRGLTQRDIQAVIGSTESISFASYVHIGDCWMGFATKVLSPRITAFAHSMNEVLGHLGSQLQFSLLAFSDQVSPASVAQLDHVGAVTISMDASGSFGHNFLGTITGNGNLQTYDIGELQIRIVPSRRKANLRPVLQDLINSVPPNQINSLDARARVTASDHMKDIFVIGAGGLKDTISPRQESQIPLLIATTAAANTTLTAKINGFKSDASYTQVGDPRHIGLNW